MGYLTDLIDAYQDEHGAPSDASIARAIGAAPQTISSWRKRGIRRIPDPDLLKQLAAFIGVDEADVLLAAGHDAGYTSDIPTPTPPPPPPRGKSRNQSA